MKFILPVAAIIKTHYFKCPFSFLDKSCIFERRKSRTVSGPKMKRDRFYDGQVASRRFLLLHAEESEEDDTAVSFVRSGRAATRIVSFNSMSNRGASQ